MALRSKRRAPRAELVRALREAESLLELCDPAGSRVKAFGNGVREDPEVRELCERHGYGAVMDSAARQWRLKARPLGGSCTTGPAVASVQRGIEIVREALRGEPKEPRHG